MWDAVDVFPILGAFSSFNAASQGNVDSSPLASVLADSNEGFWKVQNASFGLIIVGTLSGCKRVD